MHHIESDPSAARSQPVPCGSRLVLLAALVLALIAVSATILPGSPPPAWQVPGKEAIPGIVNYTRVDANLAVGGVVSLESLPELKRRGFKTVINLRKASEPDANVEAEGDAVRRAGMKYVNLPFSATDPYDVAAAQVEPFLKALADPSNLPVMIHSRQTHRPVGLLLIKARPGRLERRQGLCSGRRSGARGWHARAAGVREFAISYIKAHSR